MAKRCAATDEGVGEIGELTRGGLRALGIKHNATALRMFREYVDVLWTWNRVFRLTAEGSKREFVKNQLFDSVSIHQMVSPDAPMIDIGSGTGLPGIVLKILCPDKEVWLVEPNRRRANFLRDAQRSLGLRGLVIWEGRGEDLKEEKSAFSYFGESTAKAFGDVKKFLKISFPLLIESGSALAMTRAEFEGFSRSGSCPDFTDPIVHKLAIPGKRHPRTVLQFIKTSFI